MRHLSLPRLLACIFILYGLPVLVAPADAARACAIDNTASLSIDGAYAVRNAAAPRTGLWAPFVFEQAFAANAVLSVDEQHADLARTLPPVMLAAPYRWDFGDGAVTLGRAAMHRYAHPGLYRLVVSGLAGEGRNRNRRWNAFDSALIRVIPSAQVLGANLGYALLHALATVSGATWPIDAALVVIVGLLLARPAATGRGRRGG